MGAPTLTGTRARGAFSGNPVRPRPPPGPAPWPLSGQRGPPSPVPPLPPSLPFLAHQCPNPMVFGTAPAALATSCSLSLLVSCPVPASLSGLILRRRGLHVEKRWISQFAPPAPCSRSRSGPRSPCSRGPRVCSLRASAHGNLSNQGEWPLQEYSEQTAGFRSWGAPRV